jgi:hypothetical protein
MADLNSEHKRWSVNSWLLGVLIILIIGQGVLILGAGLSYVPIKSGYYEPLAADQDVAASPSRERFLWLEKQLAPPPLLVWSDTPPDFDFASVLNQTRNLGVLLVICHLDRLIAMKQRQVLVTSPAYLYQI